MKGKAISRSCWLAVEVEKFGGGETGCPDEAAQASRLCATERLTLVESFFLGRQDACAPISQRDCGLARVAAMVARSVLS